MNIIEENGHPIGINESTQKCFRIYWLVTYGPSDDLGKMKAWCLENTTKQYDCTFVSFGFEDRDDAMLFYLRFR